MGKSRTRRFHFAAAAALIGAAVALPVPSAEAARCPSGQMYRPSKKTCESKAGNEQFMRHTKSVKRIAPRTRTRTASTASATASQGRPQSASPFGALALPSLKCEARPGVKCTPAKLFNLE